MDTDAKRHQLEGKKDRLKGEAKDTYGKVTNDRSKQAEGKFDKAKGNVKETYGQAKEEVAQRNR